MKSPFKKGEWVGEKDSDIPVFGKVKECFADDLNPGGFLINLVCFKPSGEKIGRVSPALDGPTTYEPCISADRFQKIEEPDFPIKVDKFSRSYRLKFV